MSIVSFRKPSTSGYSGFHQRVCAPMLDRLRDAKVVAVYMGDNDELVMFRDAAIDCHFAKMNKREMLALAAEFSDLAERMKEPNPFLLANMSIVDEDGKNGLDRMEELLTTSEATREQARLFMLEAQHKEGGWNDDLIEMFLSGGRDRDSQSRQKLHAEFEKRNLRCTKDLDIHKLELEKDSIRSDMWRKVLIWGLTLGAVLSVTLVFFAEKTH